MIRQHCIYIIHFAVVFVLSIIVAYLRYCFIFNVDNKSYAKE